MRRGSPARRPLRLLGSDTRNCRPGHVQGHDYDYYPRGRVVRFPRRAVFRVYVDNCLSPSDRPQVLDLFGLNGQAHEFEDDDGVHYVCAGCSGDYLE